MSISHQEQASQTPKQHQKGAHKMSYYLNRYVLLRVLMGIAFGLVCGYYGMSVLSPVYLTGAAMALVADLSSFFEERKRAGK